MNRETCVGKELKQFWLTVPQAEMWLTPAVTMELFPYTYEIQWVPCQPPMR